MTGRQGVLFAAAGRQQPDALAAELTAFRDFGRETLVSGTRGRRSGELVPTYRNEFWTARQRAASSLHEVSYRACFKPALPRFFIERLTEPGDVVLDPFAGRGTTPLEAALHGRVPFSCDVNPLSAMLLAPRLAPPDGLDAIAARLAEIDLAAAPPAGAEAPEELLVFFHPDTLRAIARLRAWLLQRQADGTFDDLDGWIRMVAVNRLTGHSPGFFSVYTLPPNQATSVVAQRKINARRKQQPEPRDVTALILRKSRSLLKGVDAAARAQLAAVREGARIVTGAAAELPGIPDRSVDLVVTSPPFLDVVQYAQDNWLRCWFCGIDADAVEITMARRVEAWEVAMTRALAACRRVLRDGGHVAFEVGEVRGGRECLERSVIDCGLAAGLEPRLLLLQDQEFTKTANCWGVHNNKAGTNSQRVLVFRRGHSADAPTRKGSP